MSLTIPLGVGQLQTASPPHVSVRQHRLLEGQKQVAVRDIQERGQHSRRHRELQEKQAELDCVRGSPKHSFADMICSDDEEEAPKLHHPTQLSTRNVSVDEAKYGRQKSPMSLRGNEQDQLIRLENAVQCASLPSACSAAAAAAAAAVPLTAPSICVASVSIIQHLHATASSSRSLLHAANLDYVSGKTILSLIILTGVASHLIDDVPDLG